MIQFQQPFSLTDAAQLQMAREEQEYNRQMSAVGNITNALAQLGGFVGEIDEKNAAIGAMDKGVGLMSDIGAINPDIRDKFMNLDNREKPFVFDLLRQGMFAPYAAGQSAVQQAKGWADNRGSGGGGMPGGSSNNAVRVYLGP